jgi:predicted  nucleic acid-binding Zn-ribbon protein
MSSLDFELDSQMSDLESEWRQAYEAGNAARAELKALATSPAAKASVIEQARERLNRSEALMARIERLEDSFVRRES